MNNIILLSLAIAPIVALATYVYFKDQWEKEPLRLLLLCFGAGMLSCIPVLIISFISNLFFKPLPGNIWDTLISAFLVVGFTEEICKWLAVLLFAYRNKNFNEPYDGITYAVMVSLGFAAVENVLYVFQGGITVAAIRAFTAVPAHTIMGIIMGYFLGMAKFKPKFNLKYLCLSILLPTCVHGAYDFSIFISSGNYAWIGAILSLILGWYFSKKAIKIHAYNSPFKVKS